MKLLTITIPCYNSGEYMEKCVNSLLAASGEVEIIIVNDGSTDATAQIAERYAGIYPGTVKVVHKENGGHGSAVNAGLAVAEGLFFKVVDSDDWVTETAYLRILQALRELQEALSLPDMIVSNFVYEKEGAKRKKVMHYKYALPEEKVFTWKEVKHFRKGQYILMHSVMFRTALLKECGLNLPEHTFYVDNLFVFEPLPFVESIYYLNVNFYRYYIGREGQSVNESVMISRIDQQLKVNKRMIDFMADKRLTVKKNRKLYRYMLSYLDIVTTVSSVLLIRAGTREHLLKKKELWKYMRQKDHFLYWKLRFGLLGNSVNLPGRGGRRISLEGYRICQRFFNFN